MNRDLRTLLQAASDSNIATPKTNRCDWAASACKRADAKKQKGEKAVREARFMSWG